ncbi:hypothetical protein Efla_001071 [Eimeria flavescens]
MVQDWGVWVFLVLPLTCLLLMLKSLCMPSRRCQPATTKRRSPIVSLNLKGTLVDPASLTLKQSEVEPFLRLCRLSSLFTITQVTGDQEEATLLSRLKECGAYEAGLQRHRVMFCDSLPGAVSMVRQLQPLIHVEEDSWVTEQLNSKIASVFSAREGLQHCIATLEAIGS